MKQSVYVQYASKTVVLSSLLLVFQRYHVLKNVPSRMIRIAALCCPEAMRMHAYCVGAYAAEIYETWARRQGIPPENFHPLKETLRIAAMLHDIGKIAVPEFSSEGDERMQHHTLLGARLFLQIPSNFGKIAAQIALNHHERWDGSGHPGPIDPLTGRMLSGHVNERGKTRGKCGAEIPFFARIVAIADVYDALTSCRTYSANGKPQNVLQSIQDDAGRHFDPDLVEIFFASLDRIRTIQPYSTPA